MHVLVAGRDLSDLVARSEGQLLMASALTTAGEIVVSSLIRHEIEPGTDGAYISLRLASLTALA
jgi:hypothetical protein